jgi:SAM-dependent methyltransferase
MNSEFFNEKIWEDAWRNDQSTTIHKMKLAGIDSTHAFDDKAEAFNAEAFSEEGRRRAKRIMNWIEGQGVDFKDSTILDIGAASGGFSVPFAERGAAVTSVEPCLPLVRLLESNTKELSNGSVDIVPEDFEDIEIEAKDWKNAFDLVFVSMCPVIADWESVEKVLSCARQYCYMSLSAGFRENSLANEILPLITDQPLQTTGQLEMAYLLHLLYLKGYAYESLITKEMKTMELTKEAATANVLNWFKQHGLPADSQHRDIIAAYLDRTYPTDKVTFQQGGRFGKVLVRLQDQSMYSGERRT